MNKQNEPLQLLIIEDNPGDIILLERMLLKMSPPVKKIYKAESMKQAEAIITANHKIDLAFLDLSLPDSDGINSFTRLYKLLKEMPIIILSGMADTEIAVEAIALGAQDYLLKDEFDDKLLSKAIKYSIERKRNEEKLRLSNQRYEMVNKATNDTIWEWNYDTNSGIWGEGLLKTFGYPESHLLKHDNWAEQYLHPDDVERVRKKIKYHLKNKLESWQEEFRFRCADGSYKYIFDRGFILYYDDDRPYRMYGAMTDVTEKRKLEKELAEQQKLITETTIQAQEKERNELARELHDNINQILATVKMFLNMAKDDENAREDLVTRSYQNVNLAIEEIRKLSKSLVAPSLEDIGLAEALQDLIEEINVNKGIKIELNFENYTGKKISSGMKLMFYRIAQEQLNNILKHAKATYIAISLKTDEENIFMSIADNGIGFDLSKKAKGIGLKNIGSRVEFYSGKLDIFSAPGKGCKLEIKLPVKQDEL